MAKRKVDRPPCHFCGEPCDPLDTRNVGWNWPDHWYHRTCAQRQIDGSQP